VVSAVVEVPRVELLDVVVMELGKSKKGFGGIYPLAREKLSATTLNVVQ
jgi:hypothetical protein